MPISLGGMQGFGNTGTTSEVYDVPMSYSWVIKWCQKKKHYTDATDLNPETNEVCWYHSGSLGLLIVWRTY